MTNEEIIKMCRTLARKYNDPQEYDDLVSEGVVRILGLRAEGKEDKNLLYSHAQLAMNDYYNLARSPVRVPKSGAAHMMSADNDVDGWTAVALQQALFGEVVEYEEYMSQTPSTEEIYERTEWLAHVTTLAVTNLKEDEWEILKMRYWDDKTQSEVAKVLQISQQALQKREKMALDKIFRLLEKENSLYR